MKCSDESLKIETKRARTVARQECPQITYKNRTMDKYVSRYEWLNELDSEDVRNMAACWLNYETDEGRDFVENGNIELLRQMIEDAVFSAE